MATGDLSKPDAHPGREQMVPLTAAEIGERRGDATATLRAFVGASQNPENWGALAERLRRAADIVLREKQGAPMFEADYKPSPSFWLGAVHMMLLGQAVEVAAKALLVAQDPTRIDEARPRTPFAWRGWGHDLARLLRETGLMWSANDERIARLLRDFVEWGGRYPSPVNLHTAHPLEWTSGDIDVAVSVYDRLDAARRAI
jgi:hypothetical protein